MTRKMLVLNEPGARSGARCVEWNPANRSGFAPLEWARRNIVEWSSEKVHVEIQFTRAEIGGR